MLSTPSRSTPPATLTMEQRCVHMFTNTNADRTLFTNTNSDADRTLFRNTNTDRESLSTYGRKNKAFEFPPLFLFPSLYISLFTSLFPYRLFPFLYSLIFPNWFFFPIDFRLSSRPILFPRGKYLYATLPSEVLNLLHKLLAPYMQLRSPFVFSTTCTMCF